MSNAVAVYGAGQIANLYRYGRIARPLSRGAYNLYNSRHRLNQAAFAGRMAKRGYQAISAGTRKYKAMRRNKRGKTEHIGKPVGESGVKRTTQLNNNVSVGTRSIHAVNCTQIAQGNEIDQRERRSANLRGISFCIEMRNTSERPLYVNMAVVHVKGCHDVNTVHEEFFRGEDTARAIDFNDTLSSNELHCLPLNTDKFVVLSHKRLLLNGPKESMVQDYNDQEGKNYANLMWYQKIDRNIQFTSADRTSVTDGSAVYLMYWCDQFLTEANTTSTASALKLSKRIVAHWKDPQN